MLDHTRLVGAQPHPMVRRHHHQHGGTRSSSRLCSGDRNIGREMATGYNDRHATPDML
jgi:hypothetical protein